MAEAFLAQNQDPGYRELSFEERFGLLAEQESTYREDRRLKGSWPGRTSKPRPAWKTSTTGRAGALTVVSWPDSPPASGP